MRRLLPAVAAAGVLVIAAVFGFAFVTGDAPGTVPRGISVGGVEVGGLSAEAAAAKVAASAASLLERPIRVVAGDAVFTVNPAKAGLSIDAQGSVAPGLARTESTSLFREIWGRVFGDSDRLALPFRFEVDDIRLASTLDEVALLVERQSKEARLILEQGRPKAVAAEVGVALDRDGLRAGLIQAIADGRPEVRAPLREIEPAVRTEDVQAVLASVRTGLASPVTLGYQGTLFEVSPGELGAIAAPNPSGIVNGSPLTFDTDAAREVLSERLKSLEDPPVEAEVIPGDDGKSFTVTPSVEGTLIEWPALLSSLARVVLEGGRKYVPIPTATVQPRLTTLDAQELQERREIASFTTYFSAANSARVNNIRQVATILDGYVIRAGETFSFNAAVGPRTRAAGFDEAPVIRDGALTPGVGGGICQVSTTLFNAVFFAGLPVVERKPHSFYIEHYPVGRDATVSYGATDFRFRNDSDAVLLLSVSTTSQSVTVSLAAPTWDRTISYETSPFNDLVEPRSTEDIPRKLRDPALPSGTVSAVEPGVAGRSVEVRRVVSDPYGVLFEDVFTSVYSPKDFVIRVGG